MNTAASSTKVRTSPRVPLPIMAVRPGNSSGLMPNRPSQKKVFDRPSKDTDDRANNRKAMPLIGSGSAASSLAPGQHRPSRPVSLRSTTAKRATIEKKTVRNSPLRLQSR